MAQGLLTKDTELHYRSGGSPGTWTQIEYLMEVPELGGDPEQVDVTTLQDGSRKYISGITDPGDLAFVFLYDNSSTTSNWRVLKGLAGVTHEYKVVFPDGTEWVFEAQVSLKMGAGAVNEAYTFTANFMLQSDFEITNPT